MVEGEKIQRSLKILVVDDDSRILELYKQALSMSSKTNGSDYFFEVIQCQQGDKALKTAQLAVESNDPFAVVFLDLNLPPGPDGIWTGEQIRKIDPLTNFVIVTGMTNIDPAEIASKIPPEDKILYVQKPFHAQELRQFATALGAKWELEMMFMQTNAELEKKVQELEQSRIEILNKKLELENVNMQLLETNDALSILARNLDRTRRESEKIVLQKIRTLILPIVERFQQIKAFEKYRSELDLLVGHIEGLSSELSQGPGIESSLSSTEFRVASMIRNNMSTKEIADHLHISIHTVKTHRKNIRKKLNLRNSKYNLKTFLESTRLS